MTTSDADIAAAFNARINARDLDGLVALMTEDHIFIDNAGGRVAGRDACREAWHLFFGMFPDYRNDVDAIVRGDNCVIMTGRSVCSDDRLAGPALWTAKVRDGAVAEWRVRDDAPDERRAVGLAAHG